MIRVGISGWTYPPWRGEFYPSGLPHTRELTYAAERLSSVEVNGTFYRLQRPSAFRSWVDRTPDGFVLAVKGPRFVTHLKKLRDVDAPVANFLASGLLALGERLGPVLWQLPPQLGFHADVLAAFLDGLPRTHGDAAVLARRHDERLTEDRVVLDTAVPDRPLRHALEVRHESFRDPAPLALLAERDVALVLADTAGRFPRLEELTAGFGYVRLHGDGELYVGGYDEESLDRWAALLRRWQERLGPAGEVFVYFDNDVKLRAPYDAMRLIERLGDLAVPPGGRPVSPGDARR